MDFIERIFHLSPDHGSGVLEATILVIVFVLPIAVAVLRTSLKRHAERAA